MITDFNIAEYKRTGKVFLSVPLASENRMVLMKVVNVNGKPYIRPLKQSEVGRQTVTTLIGGELYNPSGEDKRLREMARDIIKKELGKFIDINK